MNRKIVLRYSVIFGLISGFVSFLFFLAMYFSIENPLNSRRPDIGISIIFIAAAIWYYRRSRGGFLHFYEGFSIGFLTNIISALLTGILLYLFVTIIDGAPFDQWLEGSKQMLINDRERSKELMNEETYQNLLKSFEVRNPSVIIFDELMFKQLAIIAVSLLSMALRKLKPS